MKKLALLLAFLLLSACAAKTPRMDTTETGSIWDKMLASSQSAQGPYRLQLSMRFGEEGDTRRVTALLWGDGSQDMRLDVMAGVGATIAKVSDNGEDFLLYAPRENKAYYHSGPTRPLLKIGVPVPFDLARLADLLTGRFDKAFGDQYEKAGINSKGNAEYELSGKMAGLLEIGPDGNPLAWRQQSGGWTLALSYREENPALPYKLELSNVNGKRAILLVKEREEIQKPFGAEQLKLELPPGVVELPLAQYKPA